MHQGGKREANEAAASRRGGRILIGVLWLDAVPEFFLVFTSFCIVNWIPFASFKTRLDQKSIEFLRAVDTELDVAARSNENPTGGDNE